MLIPHSRPSISALDLKTIISTIKSGQLAQGSMARKFERRLASYIGKKNAAATSSGSAALHLALLALDIKKTDEVIIPGYVCPAVLNAVNAVGAIPILVDIEPLTYNISFEGVKNAITQKSRAIIVPHMFGCPSEIDKLTSLGIPVIEDCAQALGAEYRAEKAGIFGQLSIFSFYATKMLTTGEGGMILSDSEDLMAKIKDLREYDEKEDYVLRYNYKMTDIQASLGLSQLARLEKFIKKRREIASLYFEAFKNCDFSLPVRREGKNHIYYRFVVKVRDQAAKYLKKLEQKKVICRRPVFKPLHLYLGLAGFPNTMEAWKKAISIPIYPSLSAREVDRIISIINDVF